MVREEKCEKLWGKAPSFSEESLSTTGEKEGSAPLAKESIFKGLSWNLLKKEEPISFEDTDLACC